MELGVILALFSAFVSASRESFRKHVSRDFSSVEIGFMGQVYGVILLFPFATWFYLKNGLTLTPGVLLAVGVSGGLVVATTYIYVEAMRISDISMTEPLRQTTPLFVAILEPLILGISFSKMVLGGALLGTVGSYIMVSDKSLKQPIENFSNRGALMALFVAFLFGIWALASRFGATNAHPLLFSYMTYIAALTGFWIWKRKSSITMEKKSYLRKDVFAMGAITALSAVAGIYAYSMLSASETTIIKQTSGVFGVLIGGRFFKEEDILRKLIGAIIIVSAVALVAL